MISLFGVSPAFVGGLSSSILGTTERFLGGVTGVLTAVAVLLVSDWARSGQQN